jgi:hypothetical protein
MNAGHVELFLWGQLDSQEQADFLISCDVKHLEGESIFEALFYEMSWGINCAAPGLDTESGWAHIVAPMPAITAGGPSLLFPESEWDRLINNAFEMTANITRAEKPVAALFRFPVVVRYLAAACFVAIAAGGILWKQLRASHRDASHTVVLAQEKPVSVKQEPDNVRRPALVFDTLVIYSTPERQRTSVSADRGEGIVRLGDKTAILLEKDAAVAVTERNDSSVAVSVTKGGVLFTVEKNRYRMFSVSTAACEVAVIGTIFRLLVEHDTTIVSVLEGSVQAIRKAGGTGVAVGGGMSARIRPDTVMIDYGDTAATLLYRSRLLHDYLIENGVWENGRFVRSGFIADTDILP